MTDDAPVHIVLGATGGIGADLSYRLREAGARLVLGARTEDRLRALAEELDVDAFPLDATSFQAVDAIVGHTIERHGRLDGVASCVGTVLIKPAHLAREDDWHDTLARNLTTAFATVRAAARVMMERGGGAIVLSAAAAAQVGLPNHEAIAAAKGGIISLVRSAAATYASGNVRVNAVAPGLVRTPATERITSSPAGLETSLGMHALGRIGEPGDVASLIAWLLDPANDWITGQTIGIDGGLARLKTH